MSSLSAAWAANIINAVKVELRQVPGGVGAAEWGTENWVLNDETCRPKRGKI